MARLQSISHLNATGTEHLFAIMDWKSHVEASLSPDFLELLVYGEPASEEHLSAAENAIGTPLPADLRELLTQANGISTTDSDVFDVDTLVAVNLDTRENYADWENAAPLDKLLCFSDINGNGDLHVICISSFDEYRTGQVLLFDHETGAVSLVAENLMSYFKPRVDR